MLNKLTLVNFRQHKSRVVDFTDGLQVLRGENEAGKSGIVLAIAYALFGSPALPSSLSETVTWGEDEKSLRVELSMTVNGDDLVFKRGKSGAEVLRDGAVYVTGQKEVSAFAAKMLGADLNLASKLMMAGQNGIRAALEEGPKALSNLIEELSDVSIIDRILEAAQTKLALGNPALIEERLNGARSTLEAATLNLPPQPDAAALQTQIAEQRAIITKSEADVAPLEAKSKAAEEAYSAAGKLFLAKMNLEGEMTRAKDRVEAATKQVDALRDASTTVVTDSRDALRTQIASAEAHGTTQLAYRAFQKLPNGSRFKGTADEFDAKYADAKRDVTALTRTVSDLERDLNNAKMRRINHDKCDKCGQDVTHLATVIDTNAKVDAEVEAVTAKLDWAKCELLPATQRVENFDTVAVFARNYNTALRGCAAYVTADETVYPVRAEWVGDEPSEAGADVAALKRALAQNEAAISAAVGARAKFDLAQQNLANATEDLAKATAAWSAYDAPDTRHMEQLDKARVDASIDVMDAKGKVIIAKETIAALTQAHDNAAKLWDMAQQRVNDARGVIEACEKDLASLSFNNALVKKLRTIRPEIANQLWGTVLATVSAMFSQMRGETSVITKGKDGFRVNGHAVTSLSGSALDLLGLSIRCALTKTFLPECDLLVLDEPAAACDDNRTGALLGFIAAAGYKQTILITHEDISSSVADNIIEL